MWIFDSPRIIFGEGALSYLAQIRGSRAFIVTDTVMVKLGFVDHVREHLDQADIASSVFDQVEPEPSIETVKRGAELMRAYEPDWIVGLGGGSAMDAAKAMWVLYERPDLVPEAINPLEELGVGRKAKLITIPTTSGTGSEATSAMVLTDTQAQRKYAFLSRETLATIAIVDPIFALAMPPRLVSDTGLDALAHAIEAYTCTWRNDFADAVCLKAINLIFHNLAQSFADAGDMEARTQMHNAASLAGLGVLNSLTSFGHALGHSFGAAFHVPHGRCSGLFLPYAMEFIAPTSAPRLAEVSRSLGLVAPHGDDLEATFKLIGAVRELEAKLQAPTCAKDLGIPRGDYERLLERLVDYALNDGQMVTSPRPPEPQELERLFWHVYEGKPIDF